MQFSKIIIPLLSIIIALAISFISGAYIQSIYKEREHLNFIVRYHYFQADYMQNIVDLVEKNDLELKESFLAYTDDTFSVFFGLKRCKLLNKLESGQKIEKLIMQANQYSFELYVFNKEQKEGVDYWYNIFRLNMFSNVSCKQYENIFHKAFINS